MNSLTATSASNGVEAGTFDAAPFESGTLWTNPDRLISSSTSDYTFSVHEDVEELYTQYIYATINWNGVLDGRGADDARISGIRASIRLASNVEGVLAEAFLFESQESQSPHKTPGTTIPLTTTWLYANESSEDKWGLDDNLTIDYLKASNLGLGFVCSYQEQSDGYIRAYQIRLSLYYAFVPTLVINFIEAITSSSASVNIETTSDGDDNITVSGVCYSTHENPTTEDAHTTDGGQGTDVSTCSISGLLPNTTYYVRSYSTNSVATGYSAQSSFTTLFDTPVLADIVLGDTGSTSISLSSSISYDGGGTNVSGFCYSTHENPTISDSCTTGGLEDTLTGLSPETLYYVRAYSTNDSFTGYSNQTSFTTTSAVSSPTYDANTNTHTTLRTSLSYGQYGNDTTDELEQIFTGRDDGSYAEIGQDIVSGSMHITNLTTGSYGTHNISDTVEGNTHITERDNGSYGTDGHGDIVEITEAGATIITNRDEASYGP